MKALREWLEILSPFVLLTALILLMHCAAVKPYNGESSWWVEWRESRANRTQSQ